MLAFSDLIKAASVENIKSVMLGTAKELGLPVENWAEGGLTRTYFALTARLHEMSHRIVVAIAMSGFLDFATGAWLTLLAWSLYGVVRIPSTVARAADGMTLTNTGTGYYEFDPGDLVFAHALTNKTYRNTTGGTIAPGETLVLDVAAEEAGTGSTAVVGAISVLVTNYIGLSCTNTVALIGVDEELDPALRIRCREKLATLSTGILADAIKYWIKSAVRPAGDPNAGDNYGVTRVEIMPASGYGTVVVYAATASGAVPSDDIAAIQKIVDRFTSPYTGVVDLRSAVAKPVDVVCTVWIPVGTLSATEAKEAIVKAVQDYLAALPIGGMALTEGGPGFAFWRALVGVVERAVPSIQAHLASEADISMNEDDVAVNATTGASVTVVIV